MRAHSLLIHGAILFAALAGGCSSAPPVANRAIDAITWQGGGKTYYDTIQLRSDGTYVRRRSSLTAPTEMKTSGQWAVLSADKQLVVLEGTAAVRLAHNDPPYEEWKFYVMEQAAMTPGGPSAWAAGQNEPNRTLPDQDKDIRYLLRP
jgi:hypothetical protein